MKKMKMFTMMLVIAILFSAMSINASAANVGNSNEAIVRTLKIDGFAVNVAGIVDDEAHIWVNYSDLELIFPDEMNNERGINVYGTTDLVDWALDFNYAISYDDNYIYICKNNYDVENPYNRVSVMRNGRSNPAIVYVSDNGIAYTYIDGIESLFPGELTRGNFVFIMDQGLVALESWADMFGYSINIYDGIINIDKITQSETPIFVPTIIDNNTCPEDTEDDNAVVSSPTNSVTPNSDNAEHVDNTNTTVEPASDYVRNYDDVALFINGVRYQAKEGEIYWADGEVYLSRSVQETLSFNSNKLSDIAKRYGYSYVQRGLRAYLNNNGEKPVEVLANGCVVDFPDIAPFIYKDRTYVPIRAIAETLGLKVEWDQATKSAILYDSKHTVRFFIGSEIYYVDGQERVMDVKADIFNDRTCLPARFLVEAIGAKIDYKPMTDVVIIPIER